MVSIEEANRPSSSMAPVTVEMLYRPPELIEELSFSQVMLAAGTATAMQVNVTVSVRVASIS